jgi:hypothetical protein
MAGGLSGESTIWGSTERSSSEGYHLGTLNLNSGSRTAHLVPTDWLLGIATTESGPAFALRTIAAGSICWDISLTDAYSSRGTSPRFFLWPLRTSARP